jgi:hypothetical protein
MKHTSYILLLTLAVPALAHAASARLSLEPVNPVHVRLASEPINVFLRDISATPAETLAGIELDFGGITNTTDPVRFVPVGTAPKSFLPSTPVQTSLSLVFNDTLLDGYIVGFPDIQIATPLGTTTGLSLSSPDLFLGQIWVSSTRIGDTRSLSANNPFTALYTQDGTPIALTYTNAVWQVQFAVVPEPASALLVVTLLPMLRRKR